MNQLENERTGESPTESGTASVSRVLILGGGFGGIYAALELERARIAYNCRGNALVQQFLKREPAQWLKPPNETRFSTR